MATNLAQNASKDDQRLHLQQTHRNIHRSILIHFYFLYKLHKNPVTTRPTCSDCAATPHALGQWVDEMLQPIVQTQPAYFKDTFDLKKDLDKRGVG